jgi:hypothetical protein
VYSHSNNGKGAGAPSSASQLLIVYMITRRKVTWRLQCKCCVVVLSKYLLCDVTLLACLGGPSSVKRRALALCQPCMRW